MSGPVHGAGRTGDVAWDTYGSGDGVPLLLLHGWSDSGACWRPVLDGWAVGRTVLTVDARGHGRTPLPAGEPFTVAALAADAVAVARDVLGRPAVVMGHSMGGLVAQEVALSAPDVVAALVLEDPAWRVTRDVDASGMPVMLRAGMLAAAGASEEDLLAGLTAAGVEWPEAELEPWLASKAQHDSGLLAVPHVWDGREWVSAMADVAAPVTLITGDPAKGAIVDEAMVAEVAALLGERLHRVHAEAAGHSVRREAAAVVLDAVDAVLAVADAGLAVADAGRTAPGR